MPASKARGKQEFPNFEAKLEQNQLNLIHRVPYSVISNSYIREPNLREGSHTGPMGVINPSELKATGK